MLLDRRLPPPEVGIVLARDRARNGGFGLVAIGDAPPGSAGAAAAGATGAVGRAAGFADGRLLVLDSLPAAAVPAVGLAVLLPAFSLDGSRIDFASSIRSSPSCFGASPPACGWSSSRLSMACPKSTTLDRFVGWSFSSTFPGRLGDDFGFAPGRFTARAGEFSSVSSTRVCSVLALEASASSSSFIARAISSKSITVLFRTG
mmetsp:Transcript_9675/g.23821  ORF Transcript_9675/g.23821 Transcript_9675/m.23821 type:complete len:203 (-) Transcript_9675:920-1528(-)